MSINMDDGVSRRIQISYLLQTVQHTCFILNLSLQNIDIFSLRWLLVSVFILIIENEEV